MAFESLTAVALLVGLSVAHGQDVVPVGHGDNAAFNVTGVKSGLPVSSLSRASVLGEELHLDLKGDLARSSVSVTHSDHQGFSLDQDVYVARPMGLVWDLDGKGSLQDHRFHRSNTLSATGFVGSSVPSPMAPLLLVPLVLSRRR